MRVGVVKIFLLSSILSFLSPSLWETARYRLKYCLKGPLNPKPTNQPNRTRTKSVLKFRILLITESSVLRKGSFPIIGQHFYHFFLLKSYFHMKLIIRLYSKSHDFFFFFFFYEFFALFLHSTFCIYSAPFSIFLYIFKVIFHMQRSHF